MVLKLGDSESRSEISGMFRNVVLEKDGDYQLVRSCETLGSIIQRQGRQKYHTYNRKNEA